MVMLLSEKLSTEIRDEIRKTNSLLSKMLKEIEEYVKFRKTQKR